MQDEHPAGIDRARCICMRHQDDSVRVISCRFSQTISEVNAMLHGFAEAHPSCTFLDCGNGFLTADRHALDLELMPDALHPSAAGKHQRLYSDLLKCSIQA